MGDSKELGEKPTEVANSISKGWFSRKKASESSVDEKASSQDKQGDEASVDAQAVPVEATVPPVSFSSLFRFATKFEIFLNAVGIVCAIAAGASQPLMTLLFSKLTQNFVDFTNQVTRAENGDAGAAEALLEAAESFRKVASNNASYLVYMGCGLFVCTYIYMLIWVWTGEINSKRIRERYLQAILRQDIAYFDKVGAGEVTTRIQTDTHLVQSAISEKVAMIATLFGSFFAGFILAYVRSWRLALAMSSILPCIALTGAIMNKYVSLYMQLSLKHIAAGGTMAEEVIGTVRTAQAFGTQNILSDLYNVSVNKSLAVGVKAAFWQGGGLGVAFFISHACYGLAFNFGTTLINGGHATPGEVINVIMAIIIGSFALARLPPEMESVVRGLGAAANLFATIDRVPDLDSGNPGGLKPTQVLGEISLENVEFSYPARPDVQVVKSLSLTFEAGKTAALVGASGSGKSTIISLVERFYDPTAGTVKLDGVDLKDLNMKWLRSQIGLVSQEPTLFATTIKGNVAHGLINTPFENVSEDEKLALIKEACIKANAHDFISRLTDGYDTMVGERGFLLSGGQKQRIAIARAIVSDPRILLLDEATSALDTQSEGIVQDALDKASAGRTTISIAHRLSTVKDADVIYVMGDGRVLEAGTHDDLLAKAGAYARLVQAQKLRDHKSDNNGEDDDEVEALLDEAVAENIPLTRWTTERSVASTVLALQKAEKYNTKGKQHGIPYLFRRMGSLVRDQKWNYFWGCVAALFSGMVYPAFGLVFASGIEGFSKETADERRKLGNQSALWFFIIAIFSTITITLSNYLFSATAEALTARLRHMSFRAILRQDIEYFDRDENSTGHLTARLSNDPQKVGALAGMTLSAIVRTIALLLVGSALGLALSWKISLVGIACIPLIICPGYIRLRVVVLKDEINKAAHAESAQLACEAAGSMRTVAALTREEDCLKMYSQSLEEPLRKSNKSAVWSQALFAASSAVTLFVIALVFWFGAKLVSSLEITTFQFFVGLMCITFSAMEAGSLFSFVPDMSSANSASSDIVNLFDIVPEIDAESETGKTLAPEQVKGHIRFENVHFRYPTRPKVRVLRKFSLEVQPGTYVALVGASGSGKSTAIQLIERFYDPLAGDVYLDGEKLTDLNVQEYRKHLALVSQEPTLYAGTIRFNILLGATKPVEEVTQEEIESACRDANILEFINSLPQGFDTEVGGKGSQLSGGQKQRIAIARALLRNPKVLLLDEATSALDSNSEKIVQAALDQAARGRTTIAIAHRLSTIQNADCIYFVKEGKVSESGTHDELLAKKGDYYSYVQLQTLSASTA